MRNQIVITLIACILSRQQKQSESEFKKNSILLLQRFQSNFTKEFIEYFTVVSILRRCIEEMEEEEELKNKRKRNIGG